MNIRIQTWGMYLNQTLLIITDTVVKMASACGMFYEKDSMIYATCVTWWRRSSRRRGINSMPSIPTA